MRLTNLALASLLLALSGPAFAQEACEKGFAVGADGDCEAVPESPRHPRIEERADPDNPGSTIGVEVTREPRPDEEPDPDNPTDPEDLH